MNIDRRMKLKLYSRFGFVNGYKDNNRSHLFANYDLDLKMNEFEKVVYFSMSKFQMTLI